ncbi:hypothetical protein AM571_CH02478 [Rhizobium etli 8C-3]|uniref:Cas12f1-like TNB domain-containing protein n=1 Tax=Rhizobium etli 8C-3 TaxID=538025 RepID=A0A1L5P575_RHIET|nr:hypothetical protein AM571_CH02478 [Rhizobium etli 8C-3]
MQDRSRHTWQTCSACRAVDRESRESQTSFHCCQCGLRAHADQNGAINILRRNMASVIVKEGQRFSVEATSFGKASRASEIRRLQAREDVNYLDFH